ncbi:MAG TPA: hypothetical protein VFQ47_05065 [Nitrososphaera sp.]|nr:hypothetical protein [Nitrososphaera sp.]
MVTAYFDATYNHPKPDSTPPAVHTVAAYVATRDNWRRFRKEWRGELDKKGLKYFHMTDFEYARSQAVAGKEIPKRSKFYGWLKDEFVPFQQRLHKVINRKDKNGIYRLEASISAVIKSDFDETLPDELKGDVQCSSYFIFNVITVIKGIALWADRNNYRDPIHYVFSGGDGENGNLERLFADMWHDPIAKPWFRLSKDYSGKPYSIEPMKGEPALQAADIAAYELHKAELEWIARGYVDMPLSELRKSLSSLARTSHYGWLYRKKELAESFADIIAHNKNRRFRKQ